MKSVRTPRLAALGLGAVASALVLAACSSGQPSASGSGDTVKKSDAITISFLQKQGDQQYFVDEIDGAKAAAKELGNVKIISINLGTDSNKAISAMDTVVGQKTDGIAVVVPDQKIGPQVAGLAGDIPLVSVDDPIKTGAGKDVPFVGFDGTQMGNAVGKKAGELYKASGWTAANTKILAVYQQGLSVCQQRQDGAVAGFKEAAGETVPMVTVGSDNSAVSAQDKTGAVLTANPKVKNWVVWGCNDESETGAVTALQNGGIKADSINGVGLGAYLTCKDWVAGKETGNKASLFISGREVGSTAVKTLVAKLRDKTPLPAKSIAKTAIVDAKNFKQAGVVCT